MKPWEAFGVEVEKQTPPLKFNRIFVMIVVILNFFVIVGASSGGWGAYGLIFLYGPMMNMILAALSVVLTQTLRKDNHDLSLWKHLMVSLGVPSGAVLLDFLIDT